MITALLNITQLTHETTNHYTAHSSKHALYYVGDYGVAKTLMLHY